VHFAKYRHDLAARTVTGERAVTVRRKNAMPAMDIFTMSLSSNNRGPMSRKPSRQLSLRSKRTNASSFAARHHAIRQQHAKGQGFLKGELTVYDDLAQSPCAKECLQRLAAVRS
jgi:hypothetical protein